jgi:uncharacterized membrane protein YeaQ/YmgE (transglycosylase-associated protein family)
MTLEMFATWVLVAALAGWLAGFVMKDGDYGLIGYIVLGLAGSLLGSWIFRSLASLQARGPSWRSSSRLSGRSS